MRRSWLIGLALLVAASHGCRRASIGRLGVVTLPAPVAGAPVPDTAPAAGPPLAARGVDVPPASLGPVRRFVLAGVVAGPTDELADSQAGRITAGGAFLARRGASGLLREPPATGSAAPALTPDPTPTPSPAPLPAASSDVPADPAPPLEVVSWPLFDDSLTTRFGPGSLAALALPSGFLLDAGRGPVGPGGAGVVANHGGALVGDVGGALVGVNGGGIIGNNGGSLVGNHGAALIGDRGGGLVPPSPARMAFRQLLSLVPRGGVALEDVTCGPLIHSPAPIAPDGGFVVERLAHVPDGAWIVVRAEEPYRTGTRTYMALVPVPADGATAWVELTPATTLAAKVVLARINRCDGGSQGVGGLSAAGLAATVRSLEAGIGEAAMVAAVSLPAEEAARVFDAMVETSPVLAAGLAPQLVEAARPTAAGGSGGGASGGGGAPAGPPAVAASLSLASHFSAAVVAGDGTSGLELGANAQGARFRGLGGLALGEDGTVFACDPIGNQVRAIPTAGATLRLAGAPNGTGGAGPSEVLATSAVLSRPTGLVRFPGTGRLAFAEAGANMVRSFVPGGRLELLAGGGANAGDAVAVATDATLSEPVGLAADAAGALYFTERGNGRLRKLGTDGSLATLATFGANLVGPLAVSRDGARIWVGVGDAVRLVRPGDAVPLDPTPVYQGAGVEVRQLAFDEARLLYLTVASADGRSETRVGRLALDAAGRPMAGRAFEPIAGSGAAGAAAADFRVSLAGAANALALRLPGSGVGGLLVDLRDAASPTARAGALLVGASFDDGAGGGFGQIVRLTPEQ